MADYASAKHEKGLPKGNPFLLIREMRKLLL